MSVAVKGPVEGKSAVLAAAHAKPFRTVEEIRVQVDDTWEPHQRLEDKLCRRFLEDGASAAGFEATKALFPFVRDSSLFEMPRSQERVPSWMTAAFYAGFEFGRLLPERVEQVLTERDVADSFRRLGILRGQIEPEEPSPYSFRFAYERIRQSQWQDVPEERIDEVLLDGLPKCLKAGAAAATFAKFDPSLVEFVERIQPDLTRPGTLVLSVHLTRAVAVGFEGPTHRQLRHPLLRLAEALYPEQPLARSVLQGFLHEALRELGVRSEAECPASEADIGRWVELAVGFGNRLVKERPAVALEAYQEMHRSGRLEGRGDSIRVREVAGSMRLADITQGVLQWFLESQGYTTAAFYGAALNQVLECADIALWIPLAMASVRRPPAVKKRKKRSAPKPRAAA